jgi:hypothetical protein
VCARRQAPPRSLVPSLIAVTRCERLVSAVTAVMTAVTGVIAVSTVIAGFVLLGPSGPLRLVATGKVAVPPVTSVPAVTALTLPIVTPQGAHGPTAAAVIARGRASRDLRVGSDTEVTGGTAPRNRCDPPRSSRHHGGHGHTAGAVIAVTAAGAARRAHRARRVGRDQQEPARLKGGPGLIGREACNRGDHLVSVAHLAAA